MAFNLVCYLNFGYPTIEEGIKDAQMYIDNGCKILQLDIPSKDPYLEHDFIKDRMKACLAREDNYEKYFEGIRLLHAMHPEVEIYFMLYENIVEEIGSKRITDFCEEVGIKYSSYVGTKDSVKKSLESEGLGICSYVQYHLPDDEIEFAKSSKGPILYQARSVGKNRPGCDSFKDGINYLRKNGIEMPIYASVGIKTPEDIKMVKESGADGAFIGSVLMKNIEDEKKFAQVMTRFVAVAKE